jgi:hypothetical protein
MTHNSTVATLSSLHRICVRTPNLNLSQNPISIDRLTLMAGDPREHAKVWGDQTEAASWGRVYRWMNPLVYRHPTLLHALVNLCLSTICQRRLEVDSFVLRPNSILAHVPIFTRAEAEQNGSPEGFVSPTTRRRSYRNGCPFLGNGMRQRGFQV